MVDIPFILTAFKAGIRYIPITLVISLSAFGLGVIIGLGIALIRFLKIPFLTELLRWVVTLLKGVPIILVLLIIYILSTDGINIITESLNLPFRFKDLNPVWIAIIGLSIYSSIGFSENFRGAFTTIDPGQFDASESIGMTRWQTMRRIIIPQAFLTMLPVSVNMLVGLVKGTALSSLIGVVDVLQGAQISGSLRNLFLESYIAAAIIYWGINALIEFAGGRLERALQNRRGGLSV